MYEHVWWIPMVAELLSRVLYGKGTLNLFCLNHSLAFFFVSFPVMLSFRAHRHTLKIMAFSQKTILPGHQQVLTHIHHTSLQMLHQCQPMSQEFQPTSQLVQ